jgi:diaminopimelate decarboxylase
MSLNASIHYLNETLAVDNVPVAEIAKAVATPVYIYSLRRALNNYERIQKAYAHLDHHIHYSAKANATLAILRTLIQAGAGIDCVSGGEIFKALKAGAKPEHIVYAGVGKSPEEIQYALEQGVGWFNVENVAELAFINQFAANLGRDDVKVALRLNPEVTANTHRYIATGHGGAKFGLTFETIAHLLAKQSDYPKLKFSGLHVHVGSQLGDTQATVTGVEKALELLTPYENMRTLNIGGGMPAHYDDKPLPDFDEFAKAVTPLVKGYTVLLEPGRSIIADAGILVSRVLYNKSQAGQEMLIVDASMTELIRPALYEAKHQVVPVNQAQAKQSQQIVGPVCETSDVLANDVNLPDLAEGDLVAILTAGAYGSVMASNYNARPRPAEVVVNLDGTSWEIARQRETFEDLIRGEL